MEQTASTKNRENSDKTTYFFDIFGSLVDLCFESFSYFFGRVFDVRSGAPWAEALQISLAITKHT